VAHAALRTAPAEAAAACEERGDERGACRIGGGASRGQSRSRRTRCVVDGGAARFGSAAPHRFLGTRRSGGAVGGERLGVVCVLLRA
jgi:hypothetical protein